MLLYMSISMASPSDIKDISSLILFNLLLKHTAYHNLNQKTVTIGI